jgi:hypothetical protein
MIKCKARHYKGKGCGFCGGYKTVFIKLKCDTCRRWGLGKPGAYTSYEGKEFTTVDGMLFKYMKHENDLILKCRYCQSA